MHKKTAIKALILLLLTIITITLFLIPDMFKGTSYDATMDFDKEIRDEFEIRLEKGEVILFKNRLPYKKYRIDPKLLPTEDLKLLYEGVEFTSEGEADSFAEDFDG